MIRVVEINDIGRLAGYRLLWDALLARTPEASFWLSLDWLQVYWKHSDRDWRLRVLVVYAGGEPIGIMPLTVKQETTGAGSVRVLTYALPDGGSLCGPIGPNPAATLTVAMRHIQQTPRDWQILDLRSVDKSGSDRNRTPHAMRMVGLGCHESIWQQVAVVDTDGTWADYLSTRRPAFRETLPSLMGRLSRQGRVRHVRYRPRGRCHAEEDPRWDLYDACTDVARRSGQGPVLGRKKFYGGLDGSVCRQMHPLAAKRGALDLNLLLLDGRPVAYCYNYHFQRHVICAQAGNDPQLAGAHVGPVLQALQIQDSIRRGDRLIVFGPGHLYQKRPWISRLIKTYRYTHYPASVRPQLLRLGRWIGQRAWGVGSGE